MLMPHVLNCLWASLLTYLELMTGHFLAQLPILLASPATDAANAAPTVAPSLPAATSEPLPASTSKATTVSQVRCCCAAVQQLHDKRWLQWPKSMPYHLAWRVFLAAHLHRPGHHLHHRRRRPGEALVRCSAVSQKAESVLVSS